MSASTAAAAHDSDMSRKAQSEGYHALLDEDDASTDQILAKSAPSRGRSQKLIWGLVLSLSIIANVVLLFKTSAVRKGRQDPDLETSRWAKLPRNVPKPIYSSTEYGPALTTVEERDRLWNALDISPGSLLLSDEFAKENGLPLSQRFPWDQTKGVYLLGAFHQMHCLKQIYQWSSAMNQNKTPERPYSHVSHCLDALLQDVWCHADDTPWYQLPPEPYRKNYDEFQTRQCRSWEKLLEWSAEHDACYKYDNVTYPDGSPSQTNQFEHYRYCKPGSPYIPTMEEYFRRHGRGGNHLENE